MILAEIKRSGYDGLLPAGVVLTGGTAALQGIADLGREYMQLPVRVGYPRGVSGMVDTISSPAYATSIGLLLWNLKQGPPSPQQASQPARPPGGRRLFKWVSDFFPK